MQLYLFLSSVLDEGVPSAVLLAPRAYFKSVRLNFQIMKQLVTNLFRNARLRRPSFRITVIVLVRIYRLNITLKVMYTKYNYFFIFYQCNGLRYSPI